MSRDPRLNAPPMTPNKEQALRRLVLLDIEQAELASRKAQLDIIQAREEEELEQHQTKLQELVKTHTQGSHPTRPACLYDKRLYDAEFVKMLRGKVPGYLQPSSVTRKTAKATNPNPNTTSTSATSTSDEPLPVSTTTQGLNAFPQVRTASLWPRGKHPVKDLNVLFKMLDNTDRSGSNSPDPRPPKEGS
jgi:hypothetical protein